MCKARNQYYLFILWSLLPACDSDEGTKIASRCKTVLLGDKDGFGKGIKEGEAWPIKAGTMLPLDFRTARDPHFTDIYPAALGEEPNHQIEYSIRFDKPGNSIKSAKLIMLTLGIQDGDNQVYGSDTDIKLYINNIEIPNAFDNVDQFDFINGTWAGWASTVEVEIPANLFSVLYEGKINVRWEILQLDPSYKGFNAFAIDYCELEICF